MDRAAILRNLALPLLAASLLSAFYFISVVIGHSTIGFAVLAAALVIVTLYQVVFSGRDNSSALARTASADCVAGDQVKPW